MKKAKRPSPRAERILRMRKRRVLQRRVARLYLSRRDDARLASPHASAQRDAVSPS